MARIADFTFGLDRYALPLLSLLGTEEPTFAEFDEESQMYDVCIQTHLYFVGDKRWAALVLFPQLGPKGMRHVLTFGRDPYEDTIVVQSWGPLQKFAVGESPTAGDERTDATVRRFAPQDLMQALSFIRAELTLAYGSMRASRAVTAQLGN